MDLVLDFAGGDNRSLSVITLLKQKDLHGILDAEFHHMTYKNKLILKLLDVLSMAESEQFPIAMAESEQFPIAMAESEQFPIAVIS